MPYTATQERIATPLNIQAPVTTGAIVPVRTTQQQAQPAPTTSNSTVTPRRVTGNDYSARTAVVDVGVNSKTIEKIPVSRNSPPQLSNYTPAQGATIDYQQEKAIADVIGNFGLGIYDELTNRAPRTEIPVISSPAGTLAYEIGRRATDGGKNAAKEIGKAVDSIIPKKIEIPRPNIQIPQVKFPQIKIPEFPQVKIPEFPELKIPEVKIPEPQKPQPPNRETPPPPIRKPDNISDFDDITTGDCGLIQVIAFFAYKEVLVRGQAYPDGSFEETVVVQPSTYEEFISYRRKRFTREGINIGIPSFDDWVRSPSVGIVSTYDINEPDNIFRGNTTISREHDLYVFRYPYFYFGVSTFSVRRGSVGNALRFVRGNRERYFEVYSITSPGDVPLKCNYDRDRPTRRDPERPFPPPPPKPRKPKKDEDMCCEETKKLLALLLQRVGDLPAKVPDDITKAKPKVRNIQSLAELQLWQVKQLDAIAGQYPIKIAMEDSDLTQEGNQAVEYTLPNIAETLAEQMGLLLQIKRETDAILGTAIAAMLEAGGAKQVATVTHDIALANADYLGYELKQVQREIDLMFTPDKTSLDKLLAPSKQKITSYDKGGEDNLQLDLKHLRTFYAMWRAQNFRQVGDKNQFKDYLTRGVAAITANDLANIQKNITDQENNRESSTNFGEFTEKVERGFIDTYGATNDSEPWGGDITDRPRIREIGQPPKQS